MFSLPDCPNGGTGLLHMSSGLQSETRIYTVGAKASELDLAMFMFIYHIGFIGFSCPLDPGVA